MLYQLHSPSFSLARSGTNSYAHILAIKGNSIFLNICFDILQQNYRAISKLLEEIYIYIYWHMSFSTKEPNHLQLKH